MTTVLLRPYEDLKTGWTIFGGHAHEWEALDGETAYEGGSGKPPETNGVETKEAEGRGSCVFGKSGKPFEIPAGERITALVLRVYCEPASEKASVKIQIGASGLDTTTAETKTTGKQWLSVALTTAQCEALTTANLAELQGVWKLESKSKTSNYAKVWEAFVEIATASSGSAYAVTAAFGSEAAASAKPHTTRKVVAAAASQAAAAAKANTPRQFTGTASAEASSALSKITRARQIKGTLASEAGAAISKITRARQLIDAFTSEGAARGGMSVKVGFTAAFEALTGFLAGVAGKGQLAPLPTPTRAIIYGNRTRAVLAGIETRAMIEGNRSRAVIEQDDSRAIVEGNRSRTEIHG